MADISRYLRNIEEATLGEEVRGSIHDAIEAINEAVEEGIEQASARVGTPVPVSTVASMEDTSKIYLYTGEETGYTADHWYYYDGSTWADGGAYNSIQNESGVISLDFQALSGYYINNSGLERAGNAFSRSVPIPVNKGNVLEFTATGYNINIAMIAVTDAAGTSFIPKVVCEDSSEHVYSYTAEYDEYVVVSYISSSPHELILKTELSNTVLNNRIKTFEDNNVLYASKELDVKVVADKLIMSIGYEGQFVRPEGTVGSSQSFNMSVPISLLAGQTLTFNATGYLTGTSILSKITNDSPPYLSIISSTDSLEHDFSYTAPIDMIVVISTNKKNITRYSIVSSKITKLENAVSANDYVPFKTIGVIGDSLASGASNYPGGAVDRPYYSWGKYIEREHGIPVTLFTAGGTTTRSWFTGSFGLPALITANPLDCYIIGLGVNDAYALGNDYLGTVDDIYIGNEDNNRDTYYGNYSKIISKIKAKSPRAKIFCITNPLEKSSLYADFNAAIRTVVGLYSNTYLIDLVSDPFYVSPEFKETWYSAHSTALGYKLISSNLYGHINDLIANNMTEFVDVQWIEENYV